MRPQLRYQCDCGREWSFTHHTTARPNARGVGREAGRSRCWTSESHCLPLNASRRPFAISRRMSTVHPTSNLTYSEVDDVLGNLRNGGASIARPHHHLR